jgi:hypothetical protein
VDGTQWKFFDLQYKLFGSESRNIRFALSIDGMNQFGETGPCTAHGRSSLRCTTFWNGCHKRKYLMLSILIQGLKQADIDIDVFLAPLREDMAKL